MTALLLALTVAVCPVSGSFGHKPVPAGANLTKGPPNFALYPPAPTDSGRKPVPSGANLTYGPPNFSLYPPAPADPYHYGSKLAPCPPVPTPSPAGCVNGLGGGSVVVPVGGTYSGPSPTGPPTGGYYQPQFGGPPVWVPTWTAPPPACRRF